MKTKHLIKKNLLLLVLFLFSLPSFAQTVFADEKANYDGVKRIVVEGRFCELTLFGENREDVQFKGLIKGTSTRGNSYKINHRLEGNTLKVWVESPRNIWGNIDASLRFLVPLKTEVIVKNSSGDVFCENLTSDYLKISASSGDVNVKNICSNMEVITSSGEISLSETRGNISLQSSSGNQEANKVIGNVKCISTSGDIEMVNVVGDISSRTSSGDQDFDKIEGQVKTISSSGDVEILNSKTILNMLSSSGSLRGQGLVLLGESYFKSTSGDVTMSFLNDFEQLSFDLAASSGSLRAGNRSGEDDLYIKSGKIWIHAKTSSGNQSFK
ncbi:hypothetical protein BZG02_04355 [Labilibaculum filiforme]|uniref:DUF4097 domain-containing protein n=1 Tax=Labilibaculum filiforme TaxID=1940526 RepID=A0A2N3I438_9BACT|nr:DUF4097 family beta strand repeat-containing protein [Labilibaculum filiforme]PKQ65068.1 hypothetical protein BZG02_04355 [Labilibaculum filiforme]